MVRISNSFSQIEHLLDDWDLAASNSPIPLLSFNWFKCCDISYLNDNKKIITIHNHNKSSAIDAATALVQRKKILTFPSYEILGSSLLHEPSDLIYKDENALEKLIQALANIRSPILFQRMPHDLPLREILKSKLNGNFICTEKKTQGSQYLNLESDIDTFESNLSSRRRSDMRRAIKKAAALGKIKIDIFRPTLADIDSVIETAFDVENSGWKSDNNSSVLSRPELERFFTCYLKSLSSDNKLVVGFLKVNNEIASMQIAQDDLDKFWLLKIGQRDRFRKISPGIILTNEIIKYAISEKKKGFEFLGSSEPWIEFWKPMTHNYKVCAIYPANFAGALHLANDTLERIITRLRK